MPTRSLKLYWAQYRDSINTGNYIPNVNQVPSNYFFLIPFLQSQANRSELGQCPSPCSSPWVGRQGLERLSVDNTGMAPAPALSRFPTAALLLRWKLMNTEIWQFDRFCFVAASFKLILFVFNWFLCRGLLLILPMLQEPALTKQNHHHVKEKLPRQPVPFVTMELWWNDILKKPPKPKPQPNPPPTSPSFGARLTYHLNSVLPINPCRSLTSSYHRGSNGIVPPPRPGGTVTPESSAQ